MSNRQLSKTQIEYVSRYVSSLAGRFVEGKDIGDELMASCFDALSRREEVESDLIDQWGNWEWPFCNAHREGKLYRPWLDEEVLHSLAVNKIENSEQRDQGRWPDGKRFALCLTHDLDELPVTNPLTAGWRAGRQMRLAGSGSFAAIRRGLGVVKTGAAVTRRNLEVWQEIENQFGFKSTFFVFPSRVGKRHHWDCSYQLSDPVVYRKSQRILKDVIREIDTDGWEIGLHGSYHSATDAEMLKDQRIQIENIVDREIRSVRQHYLHYDAAVTPGVHEAAGLTADSTMGFNRSIGFRAGSSFPFWCWSHADQRPTRVLEISQQIMDGALFQTNGLEYDRTTALEHSVQLMEAVEKVGGCLTLSWHPHHIDDDDWWAVYKQLLAEASRRDAWGCSVGQLADWWIKREKGIVATAEASRF